MPVSSPTMEKLIPRTQEADRIRSKPARAPDTFFGWMPVLYKVTEQQVLASAGLDAYVVSLSTAYDKTVSHLTGHSSWHSSRCQ